MSVEATVEKLRAGMRLDVGVTFVCWACKVQGWMVHPNLDGARHDAAEHALGVHRDRWALAEIALKLVSQEEKDARVEAMLGGLSMVPPVEDPEARPVLSPVQLDLVCEALGCPVDSRHRRKRGAVIYQDRPAALAGVPAEVAAVALAPLRALPEGSESE